MLQVNVGPVVRIERPQLRLFGHVSRIPHENLASQALLAKRTGKRPGGLPRSGWRDYICDLAWSRLGVDPAELSEIAVDHEVFQLLLGLLSPLPSLEKEWARK